MLPDTITTGSHSLSVFAGIEYLLTINGTFAGNTATLDYSKDGATFYQVKDASFTAATETRFVAPTNQMRLTLSGSGASLSVTYTPLN